MPRADTTPAARPSDEPRATTYSMSGPGVRLRAREAPRKRRRFSGVGMSHRLSRYSIAGMKIWIDADAAPREVKEVVFKASKRLQLDTVQVANQWLSDPP